MSESQRKPITPEDWQAIIEWISDGQTLRAWVRANPGKYSRETIDKWRRETPDAQAQYDEARRIGADAIAEDALAIIDEVPGRNQYGDYHAGEIARAKNRAFFRMEALKKWFPQKYGDKVTNEVTGPGGGALKIEGITVKLVRPDAG